MLGFQDECWWSRLAQPDRSSWCGGDPLRLVQRDRSRGDAPAAVACYGVLRRDTGAMMLRFCAGRPVGAATEEFLAWACGEFAREGKRVFVLVWGNAAWHVSKRVRAWVESHNERVAREGGCRIEVCALPVKAPWLDPIEPKWLHGKRAVAEPERRLDAGELRQRVCDYYRCPQLPLIGQHET